MEQGSHSAEDLIELISLFHRGSDPGQLRVLLRHSDPGVVGDGAYILSELGPNGAAFVDDAVRLLGCPNGWARFHAVDSLLAYVDETNPSAVWACLSRLADPDENVSTL